MYETQPGFFGTRDGHEYDDDNYDDEEDFFRSNRSYDFPSINELIEIATDPSDPVLVLYKNTLFQKTDPTSNHYQSYIKNLGVITEETLRNVFQINRDYSRRKFKIMNNCTDRLVLNFAPHKVLFRPTSHTLKNCTVITPLDLIDNFLSSVSFPERIFYFTLQKCAGVLFHNRIYLISNAISMHNCFLILIHFIKTHVLKTRFVKQNISEYYNLLLNRQCQIPYEKNAEITDLLRRINLNAPSAKYISYPIFEYITCNDEETELDSSNVDLENATVFKKEFIFLNDIQQKITGNLLDPLILLISKVAISLARKYYTPEVTKKNCLKTFTALYIWTGILYHPLDLMAFVDTDFDEKDILEINSLVLNKTPFDCREFYYFYTTFNKNALSTYLDLNDNKIVSGQNQYD